MDGERTDNFKSWFSEHVRLTMTSQPWQACTHGTQGSQHLDLRYSTLLLLVTQPFIHV